MCNYVSRCQLCGMSTRSDEGERAGELERVDVAVDGLTWDVTETERGLELTLFPAAAEGVDLMTRWMTAGEGSWVSVEEMR